ncbi:MAG: hypothetical protein LUE92_07590 [Clostridiales bacterium]|nr:hypothetical protein [Clostridiales bacterium]
MTLKEKKEEFLKIETWEEFDRRRLEFAGLKMTDKEVREHFCSIAPRCTSSKEELHVKRPDGTLVIGK